MFDINSCNLCARRCSVDRYRKTGFCRIDDKLYVSAICIHKGEEPVLTGENGVCNVFFDHCNLQCLYCQNYQISNNAVCVKHDEMSLQSCYEKIAEILDQGCSMLGLVSPTPYLHHIESVVDMLHKNNYYPTIIYNTNGYDNVEIIRSLKDIVDVYLPDYKYGSYDLARDLSRAEDYPDVALAAVKEMVRQKGLELKIDENGLATEGVIVRHLVLPGQVENSKSALLNLSTEISSDVVVSLMSQYYPTYNSDTYPDLSRKISAEEYEEVTQFMYSLGMINGWTQSYDSSEVFKPDFSDSEVFKS